MEIFTDRDGEVIFKKYSPIGELTAFAAQYAETLHKTCDLSVIICDRDSVVASAGVSKKEYGDKALSEEIDLSLRQEAFTATARVSRKYLPCATAETTMSAVLCRS